VEEINKNSIDELLIRYLTGFATEDQRMEAETWMNSGEENRNYFEKFKSVYLASSKMKEYQKIDTESSLKNVKQRIDFGSHKTTIRPLYAAIRIAAVLIIALGLFFIFKDNETNLPKETMVKIESFENLKTVTLPDGSVVTMNVASLIEYPENFEGSERRIKFEGEAYFEVAPDKSKPFIIETDKSETKVVGTAFNLKTVTDSEAESIVVTEGIVEFSGKTKKTNKPVRLVKGDKAVLTSELKKEKNSDLNFMAWKTGVLVFDNENLVSALKVLSDFYKVDLQINDSSLNDYTISGRYEKSLNTTELPEVLEMVLNIEIEKKGKTYWLKRKRTNFL
jgi:transmembrane sensor